MNTFEFMKAQKSYFIVKIIFSLIINALINGAFGYIFGKPVMNMYGIGGIIMDGISMAFYLGFFLSWFTILDIHIELKKKKVDFPIDQYSAPSFFNRLPKNSIIRSLLIGIMTLIIFGSVFVLILYLSQIQSLLFWSFVWVKTIFAMIMAFVLDPFVRITTLANFTDDGLMKWVKNILKIK